MSAGVELTANRYTRINVGDANVQPVRVGIGPRTSFVLEPGQQALRRVGDRELSVGIGVVSEHLAVTLTLDQESSLLRDGRPMPLKATLLQDLKRDDRKIEVRFRDGTEIRLRPVAEELAIAEVFPQDKEVKGIKARGESTDWRRISKPGKMKLRAGDALEIKAKQGKLRISVETENGRPVFHWESDEKRHFRIYDECFRENIEGAELFTFIGFPGVELTPAKHPPVFRLSTRFRGKVLPA